jgi:hypothetical protein
MACLTRATLLAAVCRLARGQSTDSHLWYRASKLHPHTKTCFCPRGEYDTVNSTTFNECTAEGDRSGAGYISFVPEIAGLPHGVGVCRVSRQARRDVGRGQLCDRRDCSHDFDWYKKVACCPPASCGAYGYAPDSLDPTYCRSKVGDEYRLAFEACGTARMCDQCTNVDGIYSVNGSGILVRLKHSWSRWSSSCGGHSASPHSSLNGFSYKVDHGRIFFAGITGTISGEKDNRTISWSNGAVYTALPDCRNVPECQARGSHSEWCLPGETAVCSPDPGYGLPRSSVCCASNTTVLFP